jgi:hypothetical protein
MFYANNVLSSDSFEKEDENKNTIDFSRQGGSLFAKIDFFTGDNK